MVFRNKNILLISPEPWDHIFVSKHHYAVHLAKNDNVVFFLNPPSGKVNLRETQYQNVYSVSYRGFIPGLRYFPGVLIRFFIKSAYRRLQKLCNVKFDVVWSFDNSVFFDFHALPRPILKISHIVDLNQNFQTKKAASTADICLATTDFIVKRLLLYTSKVYKINHGYNEIGKPAKIKLPGISPVKVIYSGNLAMPYIDWKILYRIASANAGVDFLFIGPHADVYSDEYKRKLFDCQNVFAIGRIASELVPSYLHQADILLVSYQERHFEDQANPHKMMEYLGSGRAIVATWTAEYASLKEAGLIAMSRRNWEFPDIFAAVLSRLELWNTEEKQHQRSNIAMNNSYTRQIKRIEDCINPSNGDKVNEQEI